MDRTRRIVTLVLTGGPCAGKSSATRWIRDALRARGWEVLFVPETATEIIGAGVTKQLCGGAEAFQRCVFDMQLAREGQYLAMARAVQAERVLVVFDRGVLDGGAYVDKACMDGLLAGAGLSRAAALARYDAVLHLETAAKGACGAYMTSNNAARSETAEEAAALDDRVLAAWVGHPRLRVVKNRADFDEKMMAVVAEVLDVLEDVPQV